MGMCVQILKTLFGTYISVLFSARMYVGFSKTCRKTTFIKKRMAAPSAGAGTPGRGAGAPPRTIGRHRAAKRGIIKGSAAPARRKGSAAVLLKWRQIKDEK